MKGVIEVLDRAGLEGAACECLGYIRDSSHACKAEAPDRAKRA